MSKSDIHIKESHKGLLHKDLGVPQGEPIPASKLRIKESDSEAVKKRKRFAINAKKWKHEDGGYQLPEELELIDLPVADDGLLMPSTDLQKDANLKRKSVGLPMQSTLKTPSLELQPYKRSVTPSTNLDSVLYQTNNASTEDGTPNQEFFTQNTDLGNIATVKGLSEEQKPIVQDRLYIPQNKVNVQFGNKYLQKGVDYLNQSINHGESVGRPVNEQYNAFFPAFKRDSTKMLFEVGGQYLKKYEDAGIVGSSITPGSGLVTSTGNNANDGLQRFFTANYDKNEPLNGQKANDNAQIINATVSGLQSATNFAKGAVDMIGTNNLNNKIKAMENQNFAQSVYAQGFDNKGTTQGDTVQGRNALFAEGGVQDRETPRHLASAEVEGNESLKLNDGTVGMIDGASHENGGVPVNLKEGEKVFSKRLKDPDTKKSFAQMANRFNTEKEQKVLADKNSSELQRKTAELSLMLKNKEADKIFDKQENLKLGGFYGTLVAEKAQANHKKLALGGFLKKMEDGDEQPPVDARAEAKAKLDAMKFEAENGMPEEELDRLAKSKIADRIQPSDDELMEAGVPLKNTALVTDPTKAGDAKLAQAPLAPGTNKNPGRPGFDEMEVYGEAGRNWWNTVYNANQNIPEIAGLTFPKEWNKKTGHKFIQDYRKAQDKAGLGEFTRSYMNFTPETDANRTAGIQQPYKGYYDDKDWYRSYRLRDAVAGDEYAMFDNPEAKFINYNGRDYLYKGAIDREGNPTDGGLGEFIARPLDLQAFEKSPKVLSEEKIDGKKKPSVTPELPKVKQRNRFEGDINLQGYIPDLYEREPLNYYRVNPNRIDPRYLDVQAQMNAITRGQRAVQSNLGDRGTNATANALQAQINAYNAQNEVMGNKYNYDRQQDATAQQFNTQNKSQTDQYNQQSWASQLEIPRRTREEAISRQKMTDARAAQERGEKYRKDLNDLKVMSQQKDLFEGMTQKQIVEILSKPEALASFLALRGNRNYRYPTE